MKILITVNGKSGSGSEFSAEKLKEEFSKYSIDPDIYDIDTHTPDDILKFIDSGNYQTIAACGGDGTVNFTAGLLQGKNTAFGVIPAGTLNHFAKDLNIPLSIEYSVKLIATGKSEYIDTASVNGRIFLNNSSIGIYPLAVRKREAQQSRLGRNKWFSMFLGIFSVLRKFPRYAVRIITENESLLFRSPIVFIGNNEYSIDLFTMGSRKSISKGKLSLYLAKSNTRLKMLRLVFSAFMNRMKESGDLEMRLVDEIIIESRKKSLSVSIDGEVEEMVPPLHYKITARNIKVIIPEKLNK